MSNISLVDDLSHESRTNDIRDPSSLSHTKLVQRFRLDFPGMLNITKLIRGNIESPTQRNRNIPTILQVCIALRQCVTFQMIIGDTESINQPKNVVKFWMKSRSIVAQKEMQNNETEKKHLVFSSLNGVTADDEVAAKSSSSLLQPGKMGKADILFRIAFCSHCNFSNVWERLGRSEAPLETDILDQKWKKVFAK
uniref:Uncharacterized protein n=1 Tax=Romanomermis culicivorax TaxID=13658 RepID=A0A915HI39_ROMCU